MRNTQWCKQSHGKWLNGKGKGKTSSEEITSISTPMIQILNFTNSHSWKAPNVKIQSYRQRSGAVHLQKHSLKETQKSPQNLSQRDKFQHHKHVPDSTFNIQQSTKPMLARENSQCGLHLTKKRNQRKTHQHWERDSLIPKPSFLRPLTVFLSQASASLESFAHSHHALSNTSGKY